MKNISKHTSSITQQIIIYGLAIILVLMPFHAFFSVYLGCLGLNRLIVQSWKEALVLILGLSWIIYQISRKKLAIKFDATNLIFLLIVFLSLFVTIFIRPNSEAVLFGIKTNLVAIALFYVAQTPMATGSFIKKNLLWLVLIPALIVSVLAIFQAFLISPSFLEKLGYGVSTIDPRQIIDGSIKFYRSFSTLGGPNQLGAYLLITLAFSLAYGIKQKSWFVTLSSLPILAGIILSFSRSAWIGAIITFVLAVFLSISRKQKIYFVLSTLIVAMLAGGLVISQIGTNPRLENILRHGRVFEGRVEGSDSSRITALAEATNAVLKNPFGHGLGSAGPASFKADKPFIPENWFLQIAYEIGVLGLLLYIFAFAALLGDFIRNRSNPLAVSLFSATVGILTINIFLQAWGDSTLVLIGFALYGIYKSRNQ